MRSFKTYLLGILFACVPLSYICAQVPELSVPWSFGFEDSDSAMLSNWKINVGGDTTKCLERWVISPYVKSEREKCLMISNDNFTPEFGTIANVCYAYMDFKLPSGQYVLSFDWRCLGSSDAYMCAGIGIAQQMPELQTNYLNSLLDGSVLQFAGNNKAMYGTTKWKNSQIEVSSNGQRVYRLYFGWTNSNRDSLPNRVAACVDNIQIATRTCPRPSSLKADIQGDSIVVSWKGATEQYCLEYKRNGRNKWSVQTGIQTNTFVIEGLDEGAYDFRIRGVCNDVDTSAYTYLNSFGVYYPDRHCINYVDLYNENQVLATYGTFANPYANVGVFDSAMAGADPRYLRHAVNWDPDEYDPRTGYRLKVVPEDGVASVRLGNWNNGAEAESLSFFYTVDVDKEAILLLKYAIVLEDPNHGEADQPRFTLEILDQWGYLISATCGAADFYADSNRPGWNNYGSVTWKDWTTIGLNLSEYDGETLTIRLTTRDCGWSAHFGYAYFTITCANATISGTSCGSDAKMSIEAPSGFNYEWFDKYENEVPDDMLSLDRKTLLVDPNDTSTYRCHLSYLEEPSCGFDLYSRSLPRFPIASFDWEYQPVNCQNRVRFTNKSHIMTKYNDVVEYHYDEPCDEYDWDFGDGGQASDKNPVVTFPNKGGRYPVTLTASIAEGRCHRDTTIFIEIPAIGDTTIYMDTTICDGNYVMLGPKFCGLDSLYDFTWTTAAGCDSTVYLTVHVNPVTNEYVGDTTICAEEPLIIDGQRYKQFPESGQFYRFYTNQYGCDSTIWMNVTVMDSIKPEITIDEQIGSDGVNRGVVHLAGSGYDYYLVNGERNAPLTSLTNGVYRFEFYNSIGCNVSQTMIIDHDSLSVTTADTLYVCADETVAYMPFDILGVPVSSTVHFHYKMWFDSNAIAAGFPADTLKADMPVGVTDFPINIPSGVRPGYYKVNMAVDNELNAEQYLSFIMRIDFSANVIFQRWSDVLSLYNTDVLGDSVIAFQWLKNDVEIEGATKSYYYAHDGLDLNALYSVRLLMPDSTVLYTCDFQAIENASDIQLSPTSVAVGGSVQVRVPEIATLECYNMQGLLVDSQTLEQGINTWNAPGITGIYVVKIKTSADWRNFIIRVGY